MMEQLQAERCVACRPDSPRLSEHEIEELGKQFPDWRVVDMEQTPKLVREFRFQDFAEALRFTNAVGTIAQEEGHHPRLTTQWGRVMVSWWTHVIKGLHRNDFIMAAKTDAIYARWKSGV